MKPSIKALAVAVLLGATARPAPAITRINGGDPGVFKPHEMAVVINQTNGGVWIVTGDPMPRNLVNYQSSIGVGWLGFTLRDTAGRSIFNVTTESIVIDPGPPPIVIDEP